METKTLVPVLLFDGVCNLCNSTVTWIIRHDSEGLIHFASLQSEYARKRLAEFGLSYENTNSVIFIDQDRYFNQSEAVWEVLKKIHYFPFLISFFSIIPLAFRNFLYRFIAKNRYGIFGKRSTCMVPDPLLKNRFLDQF